VSLKLFQGYPFRAAIFFYGLGSIFSLPISQNYFWDDWSYYANGSPYQTSELLKTNASPPWRSFIEVTLLQSTPLLFRIFTLVFFLIASVFIYKILLTTPGVTVQIATVVSLLFLLLPVNSARIAMIDFSYSTSFFFFFFAWYLLSVGRKNRLILISFVLFFLSFAAQSTLVFILIPILHFAFLEFHANRRLSLRALVVLFFLVISPVVYLAARQFFWHPNDHYGSYYTPQVQGTVRGFIVLGILSVPFIRLTWRYLAKKQAATIQAVLISAGLLSIGVAAFPYQTGGFLVGVSDWMINFVPNHSDWDSRHQLLLPLGFALIIGGSLRLDSTKPLRWNSLPALSAIIAFCVVLNITFAQEYFLDGKKQDSIMAAMADNEDLKNASSILVDDSAVRFNARGRLIRSYEWEGMLHKALGNNQIQVSYLQYVNCSEFQPDAILHINSPSGRLESTLRGKVAIDLWVEKIDPCGTN
jgi:hypothetical protein